MLDFFLYSQADTITKLYLVAVEIFIHRYDMIFLIIFISVHLIVNSFKTIIDLLIIILIQICILVFYTIILFNKIIRRKKQFFEL